MEYNEYLKEVTNFENEIEKLQKEIQNTRKKRLDYLIPYANRDKVKIKLKRSISYKTWTNGGYKTNYLKAGEEFEGTVYYSASLSKLGKSATVHIKLDKPPITVAFNTEKFKWI